MLRKHVIITGTGRAGTTFLVQLLTELGLDTGFSNKKMSEKFYYSEARAGLEYDVREPDAPYIVKSPYFCDYVEEVLRDGNVLIEHAFVPMRDASAVAASRWNLSKKTINNVFFLKRIYYSLMQKATASVKGGLWGTRHRRDQEIILVRKYYKMMLALSKHDIPVTLLHYPTIIKNSEYLYKKVKPILASIDLRHFNKAFQNVVNPCLCTRYNDNDC